MMKTILRYYGFTDNVYVQFTKAGSSNQSVTTQIVNTQLSNGTMSKYEAVKTQNPNWTEGQVNEELEQIEKEKANADEEK